MNNILGLYILLFLIFGCRHSNNKTQYNQNDTTHSTKNEVPKKKLDFFSTDLVYNINGISALDTFDFKKYINVLGQPDSIRRGGAEIVEEFGYDDYDLWYGKNCINAGHGYILSAEIKEAGISFNGIQVGNKQVKIETTFKIPHSNRDTIEIINNNDDVLNFYLKNKIITSFSFWSRPL